MTVGAGGKGLHRIQGIQFGVYSRQDVDNLSVVEVTKERSFDSLGHPVLGGPHDPRLGLLPGGKSSKGDEHCPKCYQSILKCYGHVGHIKLAVPVFNPMLYKTLLKILKGACYRCNFLLCDQQAVSLFVVQMEAFEQGHDEISFALEEYSRYVLSNNPGINAEDYHLKLREFVDEQEKTTVLPTKSRAACTNEVRDKQFLTKRFIANHMKAAKKCPVCKERNWELKSFNDAKLVYTIGTGKGNSKKSVVKKPTKSKKQAVEDEADEAEDGEEETEETEKEESEPANATVLSPSEAIKIMRKIWEKNGNVLRRLYGMLETDLEYPTDLFFIESLVVPPARYRPQRYVKDMQSLDAQTKNLERIVGFNNAVRILRSLLQKGEASKEKIAGLRIIESLGGKDLADKLNSACYQLQFCANTIMDSDYDRLNADIKNLNGVKQLLEKKEGLFRMHMMGKRVNFSARSVISPDPYINLNEIGIPEYFAMKWTYPVNVSSLNFEEMRKYILNGSEKYPGAVKVERADGSFITLKDKQQREAIAKSLLAEKSRHSSGLGITRVFRHLLDGDILLLNRQPSLHKPSIMAHKARVLKGEKTLRLHYANCKSYNADFDGDEMNAHFPQNDIARSEAYSIVNAAYQYLVPKDGTPLSGLIQDHIVAGVHLSIRDRFFVRADYEQLVFSAIGSGAHSIKFLPPSIQKPQQLWSGKQVISTIVLSLIPDGQKPLSLRTSSKVPVKSWLTRGRRGSRKSAFSYVPADEKDMTESDVIFLSGELLCGVLDKAQFGPSSYGLVHACFELYGGDVSAALLSCLARLFTFFLQIHGFTLGVEDILVATKPDEKRRKIVQSADSTGFEVSATAFNLDPATTTPAELKDVIEKAHRAQDPTDMQLLELAMKSKVDELNNEITRSCMPMGLYKTFPENHLQTMVMSGAKGATVNCIQMSCLLGQIELEGSRPPLMASGRTLPSFLPYECTPRSGGFVSQRFATGLRPQEYFFHCMAGREGLIDTAVKTSRSGYLQRCLIKHLEGVIVNYDLTVRDSDSTVIQFLYGEDGLDIGKTPFFSEKQLPFLFTNKTKSMDKEIKKLKRRIDTASAFEHEKSVESWKRQIQMNQQNMRRARKQQESDGPEEYLELPVTDDSFIRSLDYNKQPRSESDPNHVVEPTLATCRPDIHWGSVSEKMDQVMKKYMANPPASAVLQAGAGRKGSASDMVADVMRYKYMRSLCSPGEPVGALAAQSIGEPSTQMTLNTFHFAGRGEMNVTLGIPRLREILMTASKTIKTPAMEVPVLPGKEAQADQLRVQLNKVMFSEVVEYFDVTTRIEVDVEDRVSNVMYLHVQLLPPDDLSEKTCLTGSMILKRFERFVIKRILDAIKVKLSIKTMVKSGKVKRMVNTDDEAVEADDSGRTGADDDDDNESVNSDDEAADPEAAKAREGGTEYVGDVDDEDIANEFEEEMDEEEEGDEESGDKDNEEEGDENDGDEARPSRKSTAGKKVKKCDPVRVEVVKSMDSWIQDYKYDAKDDSWCRLIFAIPVSDTAVDPQSVIEAEFKKCMLYNVPLIKRGLLVRDKDKLLLKTEGVNFDYIMKFDKILDMTRLFSNDIQAIASRFGIEAAMKTIIRECNLVFGAYGIDVNYRHLSLIADYMTVDGTVRPFNRIALASSASPFQKMSFETSMNFYKEAVVTGAYDSIKSPSAQLVVGKNVSVGTGLFSLRQGIL